MYDKEYSTAHKHGAKHGQHQYYGDHDKGYKQGIDAHKKYGHHKYGNKAAHADHSYGKFDHLLDKLHPAPEVYEGGVVEHAMPLGGGEHGGYQTEYIPVSGDSYSGALNHGTPIIEAHSAHGLGGHESFGGFEPQSQYSSDSGVVYLPSKDAHDQPKASASSSPSSSSGNSHEGKPLEGFSRIASAVHATPAVISTATGAHYYASS